MFGIHATYFYFEGSYNVPETGVIAAYATRSEAESVLSFLADDVTYYLAKNEYARPQYKIIGYNPGFGGLSDWLKEKSREFANEAAIADAYGALAETR